jgi:DNA-binding response OmpR family regulator
MKKHILSIDDEPNICRIIKDVFTMKGYRVSTAGTAEAAWLIVKSDPPNLIILDQQLEDTDGLTLAEEIREIMPDVPILLLTGQVFDADVIQEISGKMVSRYLPKTTKMDVICQVVRHLLGDAPEDPPASE